MVDYMELYEEKVDLAAKSLHMRRVTVEKYHDAWVSYLKDSDAFFVMQREYHHAMEYLRNKPRKKEDCN